MRELRLMLLAAGLLLSAGASGQTMRDLVVSMPEAVCMWIGDEDRLDLVDFKESGMRARVETGAGGEVELEVLTECYARLRTSKASWLELRLLEGKKGQLICAVFTYLTPMAESRVRFYSTDWEEIDGRKLVAVPDVEDFVGPEVDRETAELIGRMVPAVGARLSEEGDRLTFSLDVWGQNRALRDELSLCLREVVRVWNGKRFVGAASQPIEN